MYLIRKWLRCEDRGVTLIELMIALAVFSIFISIVYPALLFINNRISVLNDKMLLNDRGKRIIDFITDDLKMIGFIIGPTAKIPYCTGGITPSNSNVITHVDGATYDSITYLTSLPVELNMTASCINGQTDGLGSQRIDYLLTTRGNSSTGANQVQVDAASSCVDIAAANGNNNGKSLITFETIAPSIVAIAGAGTQVYYTVSSIGTTLTLSESLKQDIPDNSSVFTVRQFRYDVDTTNGARDLRRVEWNSDCTNTGTQKRLDASDGLNGGVDGLQFEYLSVDPVSGLLTTSSAPPTDLSRLKAIKVWLLIRAEYADRNYTDTNTYTLGSVVLGPFNDNYKRLLLSRIVEVKNLGL